MVARTMVLSLAGLMGAGCSSDIQIGVQILDPCNQQAVSVVDWIRIEPRGSGIASSELTTTERRDAAVAGPIEIPIVDDFQLAISGHRPEFDSPASAFGLSGPVDLSVVEESVDISVPLALLGEFHQTTNLGLSKDAANRCTQLRQDRFGATATVLSDGRVLIVGGAGHASDPASGPLLELPILLEVYDPSTQTFLDGPRGGRKWELGSGQARRSHTATRLADGRVLVAGGQAPAFVNGLAVGEASLASAFLVDPRNLEDLRISEGGLALVDTRGRTGHQAVRLGDGRIVLLGGRQLIPGQAPTFLDSIEVYDPSLGAFTRATDAATGSAVRLSAARFGHTAVALPGGVDVLVAGGFNETGPVATVERLRFGPNGVETVVSPDPLMVGPIFHASALTTEGAMVLSGGYARVSDVDSGPPTNSTNGAEVWALEDNGTPRRVCFSTLLQARGLHTASVVGPQAIFVGGRNPSAQPVDTAEIATLLPVLQATGGGCFAQAPEIRQMSDARAEHAAVVLPDTQEVLVLGGVQQDPNGSQPGVSTASAELYSDFARRALLGEDQR